VNEPRPHAEERGELEGRREHPDYRLLQRDGESEES